MKIHNPKSRKIILDKFIELRKSGVTYDLAAEKVGVAYRTLYDWTNKPYLLGG